MFIYGLLHFDCSCVRLVSLHLLYWSISSHFVLSHHKSDTALVQMGVSAVSGHRRQTAA